MSEEKKLMIYFHVGPHKTGTTSIQKFLVKHFGSHEPTTIWYPTHNTLGAARAGHGKLADFFKQSTEGYRPVRGLKRIEAILKQARDAKVEKLLISSENFTFVSDSDLRLIRDLTTDCEFNLLITASPLIKRLASIWQANVKRQHIEPIESANSLLSKYRGYGPDFVADMIDVLRPDSTTLIVSDPKAEPERLLQDFFAAAGLDWPEKSTADDTKKLNTALDYWSAELLREANRLMYVANDGIVMPDDEYREFRKKMQGLFRSDEWQAVFPKRDLQLPQESLDALRQTYSGMRADLESLQICGKLKIVGDLDVVFDQL